MWRQIGVLVVGGVLAPAPLAVRAHPPVNCRHDPHADHVAGSGGAPVNLPQGLVLPVLDGPKPWSDKPVLNSPDRFHIAIMTDNTGGHRPGIWMKAVQRLNWMRPEFVMSVGDLIEGYSTDRAEIDAQWREFLGFIDAMQMRFFFVAGNHDVTNPVMHQIWRERFGAEWYSFDYKRVHFVCLSSEDTTDQIGDKQLAWLKQDLADHADARWTLLFMHKPLWTRAEAAEKAGNPDPTNWKQVERLLGERPFTVFAGHVHHYVQYDRNGRKYYHLATTGGSSQLRGVPYGEFDHVTWLTMEPDGPHIAHLLLDGILPADVVTEEGIARFRDFLARTQIEVAPILISDEGGLSSGEIHIRLANRFDTQVRIAGTIDGLPLRGLTVDPVRLELVAAPGQTAALSVRVQFSEPVALQHLSETLLTARLRTDGVDPPLTAERTIPVVIDRKFVCPEASLAAVDGRLEAVVPLSQFSGDRPLITGAAYSWTGPADASVRFGVAADGRFAYLSARVRDERVLTTGDGVEWIIDGRHIGERRADPRLDRAGYKVRATAPDGEGNVKLTIEAPRNAPKLEGAVAAGQRTGEGYDLEIAVPLAPLTRPQGTDWHSLQSTVVVRDLDEDGGPSCAVVWRGTEDFEERNSNFGQFVRPAGN